MAADTDTSGFYIDPRGFRIELKGANPYEYQSLVTRKLAQGWRPAPGQVLPPERKNERTIGVPALPGPPPPRAPRVTAAVPKTVSPASVYGPSTDPKKTDE